MNFCFEFRLKLSIVWEALSNTRKSVSSYFQTPRSWLKKKKRLRLVFPTYFSVFGNGNTLPRVWYITSQQSSSTFNLVVVTSNGRCRFYRRTILLPAKYAFVCVLFAIRVSKTFFNQSLWLDPRLWSLWKFAYLCLLFAITVCKTLLTSHSGWTVVSDYVHQSHHSWRHSWVHSLTTNSATPIKTRVLHCSWYNNSYNPSNIFARARLV